MGVIGVGVDKADGDGLDAFGEEHRGRLAHRSFVQWRHDTAAGADALVHLKPPAPRHQRLGLAPGHVEHAGRADAADLEHVAKAPRRQQPGPRADLLQDGVRGDRGAMHHLGDLARIEPRLLEHRSDAGRHALARIGRRGRRLVHMDAPAGQREHDVGERAADIHTDARSTAHPCTSKAGIFASTRACRDGETLAEKQPEQTGAASGRGHTCHDAA